MYIGYFIVAILSVFVEM